MAAASAVCDGSKDWMLRRGDVRSGKAKGAPRVSETGEDDEEEVDRRVSSLTMECGSSVGVFELLTLVQDEEVIESGTLVHDEEVIKLLTLVQDEEVIESGTLVQDEEAIKGGTT